MNAMQYTIEKFNTAYNRFIYHEITRSAIEAFAIQTGLVSDGWVVRVVKARAKQ